MDFRLTLSALICAAALSACGQEGKPTANAASGSPLTATQQADSKSVTVKPREVMLPCRTSPSASPFTTWA